MKQPAPSANATSPPIVRGLPMSVIPSPPLLMPGPLPKVVVVWPGLAPGSTNLCFVRSAPMSGLTVDFSPSLPRQ